MQGVGETPVVLLIGGGPRTGTTLLVDLLNENREIGILSEYVLDDFVRMLDPLFDRETLVAQLSLTTGSEEPPALAEAACLPSPEPVPADVTMTSEASGIADAAPPPTAGITGAAPAPASASASGITDADPVPGSASAPASYVFRQNEQLRYPKRFPLRADLPRLLAAVIATALGKQSLRVIGAKDPFFTLHHDRAYLDDEVGLPVRYALVLRSPIAQINSSLNRRNLTDEGRDLWHIRTVDDAIHEYRSMCLLNYSYLVHYGQDVLLVKHEDLVADPQGTVRTIYELVGLDGEPRLGRIALDHVSRPVLDEVEDRIVSDAFGDVDRTWATREITAAADPATAFRGLIERYPRPFALTLQPRVRGRPLLGLGWHHAFQPEGARSIRADAYLVFALQKGGKTSIQLSLSPVFAAGRDRMECVISVDGRHVSTLHWQTGASAAEPPSVQTASEPSLHLLSGTEPRTIELPRLSLRSDVPHAIRLSLSPGAGVLLQQFALDPDRSELDPPGP